MKTARYLFPLALFIFASSHLLAQMSYSVTPSLVVAEKPSDYFVFYNYAQFENLSGDTLDMRWVRTELSTSLGGSALGDWELALNDPQNIFLNGVPNSADFFLAPVSTSTDKFIYQLFPNDQEGSIVTKFKFFPIDNPSDSLSVTFDYTSIDPISSSEDLFKSIAVKIYPNPADAWLYIYNNSSEPISGKIFTENGTTVHAFDILGNKKEQLKTMDLPTGIYLVQLEKKGNYFFKKILVKH